MATTNNANNKANSFPLPSLLKIESSSPLAPEENRVSSLSVTKNISSAGEAKQMLPSALNQKILTAEGWKRMMLRNKKL
ncbi:MULTISPECIES: hypothetical protein [unclassified Neochlamydia]|uniref:hypothetical protein n=1 Tax=unclassified Neochlamydia TaxID=2643326 RepID=UPI00140B661D|nr:MULTISPECIES: hypothetical protein [unclassified Neochlamydia]MBS4165789.1 Uncharacterized protein [Neochlamydia sp. AcF65]MBS4171596.1 Uncharacterized protein [Neochlamydia sp. AcF95]NGY95540.1 hypothetical protein [Neochlamydia sp. AcF84]